jgi:hypothetical protein
MPIWLAPVIGGVLSVLSSIVGRVLIALGISYVTYKGLDLGVNWIKEEIVSNVGGMPAVTARFLGYFWVDRAITMIFSAFSAALALKTAGSTVLTKMVMRK